MIWLHGLGADGNDFAPMTAAFARADAPLRFIFPHAPHRAVGANGGAVMRAWYDIANVDLSRDQDRAGLDESTQLVHALIARLDIKSENIILGGFSQGGALALHAGLRFAEPLGAVIALSAYLPLADSFAAERNAANQSAPIFIAHGEADAVVPIALAMRGAQQLRALEYAVTWRTYPHDHGVSPAEIDEVRDFVFAALD